MHSKLILIEGLPGAGKTTTTAHLGEYLQKQGIACRWYLEEDDQHPIACLDFALKDLSQEMIPLWRSFAEQAMRDEIVTIIESRLWQNTALFMYMSEYPVEDIIEFQRLVWRVLTPLSPTLVYLYQNNAKDALLRLYTFRGEEWMERALNTTSRYQWFRSRGLDDFAGWVQFFEEWLQVAERLYGDWPHPKIKIEDPHADWTTAYQEICRFVQVGYGHQVSPDC